MSQDELLIEIDDLSFGYSRKSLVFDGFSSMFQTGATAILGPNGSGKTTLFDQMLGVRGRKSGDIRFSVNGKVLTTRELRGNVGFLPQSDVVFHGMTVGEHLTYAAWLRGCDKTEANDEASRLLDLVDLKSKRDEFASKISGGQKRRLGIGMALVGKPKFVFLDEPTVGLDPEQRFAINKIIGSISSKSLVLSSTHQVEDLTQTYGQVLMLRDGEKLFSGSTEDFLNGGNPMETYVSRMNEADAAQIP